MNIILIFLITFGRVKQWIAVINFLPITNENAYNKVFNTHHMMRLLDGV